MGHIHRRAVDREDAVAAVGLRIAVQGVEDCQNILEQKRGDFVVALDEDGERQTDLMELLLEAAALHANQSFDDV